MQNKTKITVFIINLLLCALIVLFTALFMSGWGVLIKAVFYGIAAVGSVFGIVTLVLKKIALLKSGFVLVACAFVVVLSVALISKFANLNAYPTDGEKIDRLTEIIKGTGSWGMAVYVLIQVLQVVILPLPAAICYIPGSRIWGALTATLLASLGVLIGSVIAYFIGRLFGKKVVIWIAGKETTEKYAGYIAGKGKFIFVLMQILPFFPDDILCMVAGLTSMNFPFFFLTMLFVRPVVISVYCYLGNGTLIPFSGWGIPVWIAIFAVCITLAVLSFKYQEKIEKWLVSKFVRNKTPQPTVAESNTTEENEYKSIVITDDINEDVLAVNEEEYKNENDRE
ncbi:MAG: VTT domain-containing protein [Clostridia bacterium]|nr:VTT domain-containing protein [Clostridia bacterium]